MIRGLLATAGVFALAACGLTTPQKPVESASLTGVWHGACADYADKPDLTLDADGKFSVRSFPYEKADSDAVEIVNRSGTWSLWTDKSDAEQQVDLFFSAGDSRGLKVSRGDQVKLVLYIGDPDNGNKCTFARS